MSHVTCAGMSHVTCEGMSHVKYMSESRYIRMSLVTHTNGTCYTYG